MLQLCSPFFSQLFCVKHGHVKVVCLSFFAPSFLIVCEGRICGVGRPADLSRVWRVKAKNVSHCGWGRRPWTLPHHLLHRPRRAASETGNPKVQERNFKARWWRPFQHLIFPMHARHHVAFKDAGKLQLNCPHGTCNSVTPPLVHCLLWPLTSVW